KARADGTIMLVYASPGWKFGDQFIKPAFWFYEGGLVVKAELNQEWAHLVKVGQSATVHDDGGSGQIWKGKVTYIARSYLPARAVGTISEGVSFMQQAQELVLECRITLDPDQPTPFLNQKVRVKIGQ